MPHYLVRGLELKDGRERQSLLLDNDEFELKLTSAVELTDSTRDAEAHDIDIGDVSESGIVELEFDDEICMWVRPSELRELDCLSVTEDEAGTLKVSASPDTTRDGRRRGLRLLRLFRFKQTSTQLVREKLVEHIESKPGRKHGLYRLRGDGEPLFKPFEIKKSDQADDDPWLVLIHGTASTTAGSFGSLWQASGSATSSFGELRERYGPDRILALEHRTLSVDPIVNAQKLVEALPTGARLHLLSHSRGGLVAELLARRADDATYFSDADFAAFEEACREDQEPVKRLRELDRALREKRITVERLVRVACPARGTTLASKRLERWLSITLNLLNRTIKYGSMGTGPALAPTIQMTSSLLKGLLLNLAKLEHLPGLKSMDPHSPVIRGLINAESARSNSELVVIAGQCEGSGFFRRLLVVFANVFFSNRNDLVVDTPAMYGGAQRESENTFRFQFSSSEISHFRYFSNPATARPIVASLRAPHLQLVDLEPFEIDQSVLRTTPLTRAPATRSSSPKPPVCVVIPGIMGTHLRVRDKKVWIHYLRLLRGQFSKLAIDTPNVEIDGIDGGTYTALVNFLAQTHHVVLFPYDWRLPIEEAGQRLNRRLHELLDEIDRDKQPVRIVAHSMGGLVARSMMLQDDSAWPEVCTHDGARLLMMGTPNAGSHAISLLLAGEERLLRRLAMVDLRNSRKDMVSTAAGFSGALDMIPWPSDRDYFTDQAWKEVLIPLGNDWPRPTSSEIRRARAWRKKLQDQQLEPNRVFYIAGHEPKGTPEGIEVKTSKRRPLSFLMTAKGDGRVPWDGGIPEGITAWYIDEVHGNIPNHRGSHQGYLEILEHGDTTELNRTPPVTRSRIKPLEMEYWEPTFLPNAEDLVSAAMGSRDEDELLSDPSPPPRINIRMVWGDLAWSRSPIVVGHYAGDTIVSAEAALDRHLDGELSRRKDIGIYPGKIGTSLLIGGIADRHPGAIVLGLGPIGNLTRGDLAATVRQGLLSWAGDCLGGLSANDNADCSLAFVMVGTGSGGLPMRDAARSLLLGIDEALERLGPEQTARLGLCTIDFIELYEDRAHTFWHALGLLLNGNKKSDPSLARFRMDPTGIKAAKNGRRRLVIEEGNDWWSPLRITMNNDVMVFESIGDRARAEHRGVGTELAQIEQLINKTITSSRRDPDMEVALFEMLVPNDLKEAAPKLNNTRLLVDRQSAWIPWELLADRDSARKSGPCCEGQEAIPQSVLTGMVRQFVTDDIRQRLRTTEGRCALVIGDPDTQNPNDDEVDALPELPAAREEARRVHQILEERGFHSRALIGGGAEHALKSLFRCGYRLIHLAGHGVLDSQSYATNAKDKQDSSASSEPVSGFVIGHRQVMTHKHIEQLREVPELVFINCCHLSAIKPGATRLAADFGEQFIRQGVRAVIAAGWAVEDSAALHFADAFYQSLFGGQTFGDAVLAARKSTYLTYPNSNTWAAYQCYGDPSYRLIDSHSRTRSTESGFDFATPRHLINEGIGKARSIDELVRLENQIKQDWSEDKRWPSSELLYAFANRYSQLGDLARARDGFGLAIERGDSDLPVRAIEQRANLQARLAVAEPDKTSDDKLAAIEQAREDLRQLDPKLTTGERQAIMASTYKREAMIVSGKARITALEAAAKYYEQRGNWEQAKKQGNSAAGDTYGLLQAATVNAALWWLKSDKARKRLALRQIRVCEKIEERLEITDDFWKRAMKPDLRIARSFVTGALSESDMESIARQYIEAASIARDLRQLASVIDNIEFMALMLDGSNDPKRKALRDHYFDMKKKLSEH